MNTGKAYGYSLVQAARALLLQGNFQAGMEALKRLPLVTYGTPGAADIQGILQVYTKEFGTIGRFLAIEVKKPGESIEPESPQAKWREMVRAQGGLHIEAHSVEEVWHVLRAEGYPV